MFTSNKKYTYVVLSARGTSFLVSVVLETTENSCFCSPPSKSATLIESKEIKFAGLIKKEGKFIFKQGRGSRRLSRLSLLPACGKPLTWPNDKFQCRWQLFPTSYPLRETRGGFRGFSEEGKTRFLTYLFSIWGGENCTVCLEWAHLEKITISRSFNRKITPSPLKKGAHRGNSGFRKNAGGWSRHGGRKLARICPQKGELMPPLTLGTLCIGLDEGGDFRAPKSKTLVPFPHRFPQ